MANPFDQFDTKPAQAAPVVNASGANPFDQFDAPAPVTDQPDHPKTVADLQAAYKRAGQELKPTYFQADDDGNLQAWQMPTDPIETSKNERKNKIADDLLSKRSGEFAPKRKINEFLDDVIAEKGTPSAGADIAVDIAASIASSVVNPFDTAKKVGSDILRAPQRITDGVINQSAALSERAQGNDEMANIRQGMANENMMKGAFGVLDAVTLGKGSTGFKTAGRNLTPDADDVRAAVSNKITPEQRDINFKKWFGDSKVVDESGKPLTVYHGTKSKTAIDEFKPGGGLLGDGIYFTTDKNYAKGLAGKDGHVVAAHIRIQNPTRKGAHQPIYAKNEDGVIATALPGLGKGEQTFLVKDPRQIKSVKNSGKFDTESASILDKLPTPKPAPAKASMTKPERRAREAIYRAAKRNGLNRKQVDDAIEKARVDGNPETFWQHLDLDNTAKGISAKGNAPGSIIDTQARKEVAGQGSQITKLFEKALDNPRVGLSPKRIERAYKAEAKPLYDEAYKANFRASDKMGEILSSMEMQDRLAAAATKLKRAGHTKMTATQVLHEMKKTLDDDISKAFKDGRGNDAIAMKENFLKPMLKELDAANPAYAKARAIYSSGNSAKRATEAGQKIFTIDQDDLVDMVEDMSKADLVSFQNGVMRAARKQLDAPDGYNSVRPAFRKPSFAAKIESVVGKKDADKLLDALDKQAVKFSRNKNVDASTNSQTASRTEAIKQVEGDINRGRRLREGAKETAANVPRGDLSSMIKIFGPASDKVFRRMDNKTLETLANIMTNPIKDAPDIFKSLPKNRRLRFIRTIAKAGNTAHARKTAAKRLAILNAIEAIDGSLTAQIEKAKAAVNDNSMTEGSRAKTANK